MSQQQTAYGADERGYFGETWGGRFMPEALVAALDELTEAWQEAMADYAGWSPHIAPGGVFAQWMHLYEMNDSLALTMLAAQFFDPRLIWDAGKKWQDGHA